MNWRDQVVLITGASSGIGAALGLELARRGAAVVLAARRRERIEALARQIVQAGGRALAVACDVREDKEVERAFQQAHEHFGVVHNVVANAGFGVSDDFVDLTLEDYRRQFETNVFGVLRTLYAGLSDVQRTQGQFVLIGSVTGFLAPPGTSPYAMSKFAIHALAQTLYHELRPLGIHVMHVAPGFIQTEFRKVDHFGRMQPQRADWAPRGLRMSADKAAVKIADAMASRRREVVLTWHAKALVALSRYGAWSVAPLVRLFKIRRRPNTEAKVQK